MKPSFHAAHTGLFGATDQLPDRQIAKPVKQKKGNSAHSVVPVNAVDLRQRPNPNKNKSNKPRYDQSSRDSENKGDRSRGYRQGKYRDQSPSSQSYNSRNKKGKPKVFSKEYKDNESYEKKPSNKGKPNPGYKYTNAETVRAPKKNISKPEAPVQIPPFVSASPLRNPKPGQEHSFYAQFGRNHCVVSPLERKKKSEN